MNNDLGIAIPVTKIMSNSLMQNPTMNTLANCSNKPNGAGANSNSYELPI